MGKVLGVIVALLVAVAAAFGGYAYGRDRRPAALPQASPTPTATTQPLPPTQTPTGTPTPTPSATPTSECADTADTQVEMNECAATEAAAAQERLDRVLAEIRRGTTGERRTALDTSQREWETYRKTFCDSYLIQAGTISLMNVASCRADLTLERARDVCHWASPNVEAEPPACRGFSEETAG